MFLDEFFFRIWMKVYRAEQKEQPSDLDILHLRYLLQQTVMFDPFPRKTGENALRLTDWRSQHHQTLPGRRQEWVSAPDNSLWFLSPCYCSEDGRLQLAHHLPDSKLGC